MTKTVTRVSGDNTVYSMPHLLSSVTLVHKASSSYLFLASFLNYLNAVAIAGYFINYVTETRGETSSALGAKFLAIAQGCFAIGRFSGSGAFPAVVTPLLLILA